MQDNIFKCVKLSGKWQLCVDSGGGGGGGGGGGYEILWARIFFLTFLNKPMQTESDFGGLIILQLSPP